MSTNRLVLFDIDGTLIDSGGAGRLALVRAFNQMYAKRDAFDRVNMAGKTDIQIIAEGLAAIGETDTDGTVPAILDIYLQELVDGIRTASISIKPGIIKLLDYLATRQDVQLGLLTGNIETGARIKLGAVGLNKYFPFGAFGSDHRDRNRLLPIAVRKHRKLNGLDTAYRDCIVIGDTPRDVQCAKPYGAVAVAVATGRYGLAALRETGADYVFEDLTGAAGVIKEFQSAGN